MGSAPAGASNAEAAVNWLFANASDHPADGDAVFEPHDPYFVCATRDEAALFSRGEARARLIDASERALTTTVARFGECCSRRRSRRARKTPLPPADIIAMSSCGHLDIGVLLSTARSFQVWGNRAVHKLEFLHEIP